MDPISDDLCALCDNGGEVLCCDGGCLRSFHATVEAGYPEGCKSLGISSEKVKAMKNFICMNCQNSQHQCFACGKLGSSRSNNPEVFQCASLSCGHFYHPRCIAKLLHPINEHAAEQVKEKIIARKPFTCTVHRCSVCKQEEDENVEQLQFAICRRCPKVYHRKCLPSGISFDTLMDKGILQRAWDNLIPDRIVIYCLKHEIDVHTLAPQGNHIVFPDVSNKKKVCLPTMQPSNGKIQTKKIGVDSRNHPKIVLGNQLKQFGKMPTAIKGHSSSTNIQTKHGHDSRTNFGHKRSPQVVDTSRLHVKDNIKRKKVHNSQLDGTFLPMKEKCSNQMLNRSFGIDKSKQKSVPCGISNKTVRVEPILKRSSGLHSSVRTETEINGMHFMKGNSSFKTPTQISPRTYPCNITDQAILKGSIEGSVKAVDTSMHKLVYPCNIIDEAILKGSVECSVKVVDTSMPKLKDQRFDEREANYNTEIFSNSTKSKIADTLLCYAKPGDLMANFYCHANDFSCPTREKFEEISKNCSIKTYDVFQWQEFDFKKISQMPTGSRLIIGVIFPSKADPVHANKFIDKVLAFKPKLLLLICPRGTKRLSQDECEYDLVWEESESVSCKSYILESICSNERANRRTFESALIFLWSRGDWTSLHKSIASTRPGNDQDMETTDARVLEHTSENDLNQDPALFAHSFLPLFSSKACGWLDE